MGFDMNGEINWVNLESVQARLDAAARERESAEMLRQILWAYYITLAEDADASGDEAGRRAASLKMLELFKGEPGYLLAEMIATLGAGPAGGVRSVGGRLASTIGGEAMDAVAFARIRAAFERNGGKILQGGEVDAYLTYRGAEGLTDNAVQMSPQSWVSDLSGQPLEHFVFTASVYDGVFLAKFVQDTRSETRINEVVGVVPNNARTL